MRRVASTVASGPRAEVVVQLEPIRAFEAWGARAPAGTRRSRSTRVVRQEVACVGSPLAGVKRLILRALVAGASECGLGLQAVSSGLQRLAQEPLRDP